MIISSYWVGFTMLASHRLLFFSKPSFAVFSKPSFAVFSKPSFAVFSKPPFAVITSRYMLSYRCWFDIFVVGLIYLLCLLLTVWSILHTWQAVFRKYL